jgi:hypothetical protein
MLHHGLESLTLDSCNTLSSHSFLHFTTLTKLKILRVINCFWFDNTALMALSQGCLSLVELDFSSCGKVTVDGLANLSQLTRLRSLVAEQCQGVCLSQTTRNQLLESYLYPLIFSLSHFKMKGDNQEGVEGLRRRFLKNSLCSLSFSLATPCCWTSYFLGFVSRIFYNR